MTGSASLAAFSGTNTFRYKQSSLSGRGAGVMTGSLEHGLRAFGAEPRSPLGHIADGRHLGHAILRAAVRRRCCVVDCRCPVLGDGGEELVKKACGEKFFGDK